MNSICRGLKKVQKFFQRVRSTGLAANYEKLFRQALIWRQKFEFTQPWFISPQDCNSPGKLPELQIYHEWGEVNDFFLFNLELTQEPHFTMSAITTFDIKNFTFDVKSKISDVKSGSFRQGEMQHLSPIPLASKISKLLSSDTAW